MTIELTQMLVLMICAVGAEITFHTLNLIEINAEYS